MNRWENLHVIVYWNGAMKSAISVYSNGCKVEALCGAEKAMVIEYLHTLRLQGWEKFARERPAGDVRETFYFQRPMDKTAPLTSPSAGLPEPRFLHHPM